MKWNTTTPPREELILTATEVYDRDDERYYVEYNVCYIDEEENLVDNNGDVLGWTAEAVHRWVLLSELDEDLK